MSHGAGAAGTTTEFRDYQWAYNVMDSSRVSTCLISMLLIVYGSFRSLNMEQEQREREKKRQNDSMNNLLTGEPVQPEQSMCALLIWMWLNKFHLNSNNFSPEENFKLIKMLFSSLFLHSHR